MIQKCGIRACEKNLGGECAANVDGCELLDWKSKNTAEKPIQYRDEDEPILRCPSCDENVTDLMDCGFNFCPYCGKRWY